MRAADSGPTATAATKYSSHVRRELHAYQTGCACTQLIEAQRIKLHATLERVVVFDVRFGWNGLGDSLDRWINLLRLGAVAGRAAFLWMSDRVEGRYNQHHRHAAERDAAGYEGFDLGEYFVSIDGADWQWSSKTAGLVAQAMARRGVTAPLLVDYRCDQPRSFFCAHARLRWTSGASSWANRSIGSGKIGGIGGSSGGVGHGSSALEGSLQIPTAEAESAGVLVEWIAARREPWLLVRTHQQLALEASGRAALAALTQGPHSPCAHHHDTRGVKVAWRPNATRPAVWSAVDLNCEAFALLRPRPWFELRLRPHLGRLEALTPLVAIHLRTGFVDFALWNRLAKHGRRVWAQAASMAARPLTFGEHWRAFEELLVDCSSRTARERQAKLQGGTMCFDWRSPRVGEAPSANDGRRCADDAHGARGGRRRRRSSGGLAAAVTDDPQLGMPGNGTLAASLECAAAVARRIGPPVEAAGGADAKWGLLVLSDSPGALSLVDDLRSLRGRAVSTSSDSGGLGNIDGRFGAGARTREAWARSMVDFYLGGLADGLVTVLPSGFFRRAVLRRSLLCCKRPNVVHFGALTNRRHSHRGHALLSVHALRALMQVGHVVP
jgi:hypothetical protein